MEKTEEQLIAEYYQGDREALRMIYERYKFRILNFSLRLLKNRADAEEVTGDVFLALLSSRFDTQRRVRFSTWIYTIARNKCVSRIRRRQFQGSLPIGSDYRENESSWDVADQQDLSRDELIKKEMADRVLQAINALPYEYREAIVLRQYHGMSYEQISVILNCSLAKVKILIFRAKEQLRNQLASFIQEEPS